MFYDTIKGGDFRSREANVYRLAECGVSLIDQAVAQGVPFRASVRNWISFTYLKAGRVDQSLTESRRQVFGRYHDFNQNRASGPTPKLGQSSF
jgi:succinate dehydrogenase/fumarate reductase flavoprotein subunit